MNASVKEKLGKPFDASLVKKREGPGRRLLDYVPHGEYIKRMLDSTEGYSWTINSIYQTQDGKYWICHGTISLFPPDASADSFDGIGTHPALDVESPKAAESDAFKRACLKAGVGLQLYVEDEKEEQVRPIRNDPGIRPLHNEESRVESRESREGPCPVCHAPADKPHASKCPEREV